MCEQQRSMKFTGERYVPGLGGDLSYEHLHRYALACEYVSGMTVLDIASGEGYGSSLLARTAKKVIGVDVSEEAVSHAKAKYKNQGNLEFMLGSCTSIPVNTDSFDVVVSFETIEHIADQDTMLGEIKRVLKPGGSLIISSPNRKTYSDNKSVRNEYHVHELYLSELESLLRARFKHISVIGQRLTYSSHMWPIRSVDKRIEYIHYSGNDELLTRSLSAPYEALYFIAICSDTETIDISSSLYTLSDDFLFEWHSRLPGQFEDKEKEVLDLRKQLDDQGIRLAEKEQNILVLDRQLVEKERQLVEKDQELVEKDRQLVEKERQLVQKERQLIEKDQEFIQKERQLIEKDQEFIQKERQLIEKDQELEGKSRQLVERDLMIQDIYDSLSWRVTRPLRKGYEFLGLGRANLNDKATPRTGTTANIIRVIRTYDFKQAIPNIRKYGLGTFLQNARREILGAVPTKREEQKPPLTDGTAGRLATRNARRDRFGKSRTEKEEQSSLSVEVVSGFDLYEEIADADKPLVFQEASPPLVSIIIPVYNKWEYTYSCLCSILDNSVGIPYEVIVADDVSTDGTVDIHKYVEGVRVSRNDTNLGFTRNCRRAAMQAKGKYILFLNNDINVQKDWLKYLLDLSERNDTIGMVGSKLVYPDGRLQEAGGVIWKNASGINYGWLDDPAKPEYNYVKEVDYISGACIMIRKDLWERIGGFDEIFSPAYYEDTDLAFAVRREGYRVVYQPKSVVVHFEGISHGTDLDSGIKNYQVRNKEIFLKKWKDVLQKEHFAGEDDLFLARDRSSAKKTILFIDYEVPRFDMFAGSRTNYMYMQLLVELGLNVKFLGADFRRVDPYASALEERGIEVLCGDWYRENWRDWLSENGEHIEYVLINKPDTADMFIDEVRLRTKACILYQGHDLHFLRLRRRHEADNSGKALEEAEYYKKLECDIFNKADIILTFSEVEKKVIEEIVPHKRVVTVPLFFYDEVSLEPLDFSIRKDIMFVGGYAHEPNVDAVVWFCRNILPLILKRLPDIKFRVVGSSPPETLKTLSSRNVEIVGGVTDEELAKLYGGTRLVVIPLRFGAGVKGKLVEAMHMGLPVVSTSIGLEGIEGIEAIIKAKDSEVDFADEVVALYNNEQLDNLSKIYRDFIMDHFSRSKAGEILSGCLRSAREECGVESVTGNIEMSSKIDSSMAATARLIAFYLPQYHPIPENDEWWGKGFTEWRNVANATPQFVGHYQPRLPGELGFYDLRVPEVRKAQADLAREYGIEGFCYYHYWFNGKLLLEQPLHEMLESGEPDFPFCLCWANEDWTRAWDGRSGQVLVGQRYNDEDDLQHLQYLIPFFKDRRYIRVNGKPLFLVYRAALMPNPAKTAELWRAAARQHGIEDLYLCRVESFPDEHADPKTIGFDASIEFQPDWDNRGPGLSIQNEGGHSIYEYSEIVRRMMNKPTPPYKRFPGVCPSWDNSARRKRDAIIFINSSPEIYRKWLSFVVEKLRTADPDERIVFINAWNEWAEGNYLEPDQQNGRAYLEATRHVLEQLKKKGRP